MDALNENYKEALEKYINLQEVLVQQIGNDIERNSEDIRFEMLKKQINEQRLTIEKKSLELAKENLKTISEETE
ncbi:hypothetical protein [Chryseobacterium sp. Hurlbut01]|uniref:hypothetical protein n=1 Tax=Chryseobacterium sp. Hurlbut01 TaxID=1681828 RepID=UPI00067BF578|nr:hypothetical protein [Chryseobacterium sp. Hurlbut01]KNB60970.1 hypothetical protein AC804_17655 [Chryseobacterium sp. Hurlbut01]